MPKTKDTIEIHDTYAVVQYKRLGIDHEVRIPFNRRNVSKMLGMKVTLQPQGTDITQQPGMEYLLTASQMGGTSIEATDCISGETYMFDDVTPPKYII